MKFRNELNLAGLLLMISVIVLLITVFFEYRVGWISASGYPDDIPEFIRSNWSDLESIWFWQMFANVGFCAAYMIFLKRTSGLISIAWALLVIGSLMVVVAFGLTLGSYSAALDVYDVQPELFQSTRGGIRSLYSGIRIGGVLFIIIYLYETLSASGVIPRRAGSVVLSIFVLGNSAGILTGLSPQLFGLGYLILPLMLGFSYWNDKRDMSFEE